MELLDLDLKDIANLQRNLPKEVEKAIYRMSNMIATKARAHLISKYPKTAKKGNGYSDSVASGIYYGKMNNGEVKVSALGNSESSSQSYKARFFVGGTDPKKRFVKDGYRKTKSGIKYVKYKKPMYTGSIEGTNSLVVAFNQCKPQIEKVLRNLINKDLLK